MYGEYSVQAGGGHATSTFSHYFNGHKLAFYQTYPDLSITPLQPEPNSKGNVAKIKKGKLRGKKKVQHVCHCTVNNYLNGRLGLKFIPAQFFFYFILKQLNAKHLKKSKKKKEKKRKLMKFKNQDT